MRNLAQGITLTVADTIALNMDTLPCEREWDMEALDTPLKDDAEKTAMAKALHQEKLEII